MAVWSRGIWKEYRLHNYRRAAAFGGWADGGIPLFDRNSPAQSGPDGVIRTMAYQLALSNPTLRDAICKVIERDPQIGTRTLITQFNDLIKTPLTSCAHQVKGPVVIILDAFDECGNARARQALLHLLVKELPLLPHQFRFLITSRPEPDLNDSFQSREEIEEVSLSSEEWSSSPDVLLYIEHEMHELYMKKRKSNYLPQTGQGRLRLNNWANALAVHSSGPLRPYDTWRVPTM